MICFYQRNYDNIYITVGSSYSVGKTTYTKFISTILCWWFYNQKVELPTVRFHK